MAQTNPKTETKPIDQSPGSNSCRDCKWATFRYTNHRPPRLIPNSASECEWPHVEPLLPLSITKAHDYHNPPHRGWVTPAMSGCPVWEGKG